MVQHQLVACPACIIGDSMYSWLVPNSQDKRSYLSLGMVVREHIPDAMDSPASLFRWLLCSRSSVERIRQVLR